MRIAIAGGTGTLGRLVATRLRVQGHDVRVLSRSAPLFPVDLRTGAGLEHALEGCEAVVDASNDQSKQAAQLLVEGSRRLLAAELTAGVRHHVCVSVVGCDQVPLAYFRLKAAQEQVVEQGPVPWTIVRATQFHELLAGALQAAGRWPVLPVPRARLRTVACAEVAGLVAGVAAGPARRTRVEVAGPEPADARELVRSWRAGTGRRTPLLLPVPLPGRLGRALRAGALSTDHPAVRADTSFSAFLTERQS